MDRRLARKNIRFGTGLLVLSVGLLGSTFVWAAFYLSYVK
jgi:hypothetical protein